MLYLRKILILALLSLAACTQVALGTEESPRVNFRPLLPAPAVIEPGVPQSVAMEMAVRYPAVVSDIEVTGKGWSVSPITRTLLEIIDSVEIYRIEFELSTDDDSQPIEFSYVLDETSVVKTVDISADRRLGRDTFELAKSMARTGVRTSYSSDESFPDFEPAPFNPAVFAHPHETEPAPDGEKLVAGKSARIITISGEFRYKMGSQTRPGHGATVFAFARTPLQGLLLGSDRVEVDGTYTIQAPWLFDPILPDIYMVFKPSNSGIQVIKDDFYVWDPNEYFVYSKTFYDVEGTSLDADWTVVEGWSRGAFNVLHSMMKGVRYLFRYGGYHTIPGIEVRWPSDDDRSAYTASSINYFRRIRIARDDSWNAGTHLHEYGHFINDEFGHRPGEPNYCNGRCNDDPDDLPCPHFSWCYENSQVAWSEGFPNWFADSVCRDWTERYTDPPKNPYDYEVVDKCGSCDENWYHDPWITEGRFAAAVRDLEDSGFEYNTEYSLRHKDRLDLDPGDILEVFNLNNPTSTHGFFTYFTEYMWNNHPDKMADYWETCAFNGYFGLDTTPPSTPMLYSTTHPEGEWSTNNDVQLNWSPAEDDFSGVGGYCYGASTTGYEDPGYEINTTFNRRATSYTVEDLSPGYWYFTLRAVDRDGNWDPGYERYGPVQIVEPAPGDLKPEQRTPHWVYPLVPKDTRTATENVVPSDTEPLLGNFYWNASVVNLGEETTSRTHAMIWIDGQLTTEGFYMQRLETHEFDFRINQGPIHLRGGRHTFELFADNNGVYAEVNETNNRWGHQWIWMPDLMPYNAVYTRPAPPLALGGWGSVAGQTPFYNCDGLRILTATGLAPDPWVVLATYAVDNDDDVDLQLHDDPTTAWSGFDITTFLNDSRRPAGYMDAVLVNAGNRGRTFYSVGVYDANDHGPRGDYRVQVEYGQELDEGVIHIGMLGYDRGIDLFAVDIVSGGPMQLFLQKYNATASPPIYVGWYDSDFVTGGLLDYDAVAVTGDEGWVRLDLDVVPGTHGLLLWRDPADAYFGEVAYTLRVQQPPPDLAHHQPTGWDAPLVPSNGPRYDPANVPEPTALTGDLESTCINLALENLSATHMSSFYAGAYVDGVRVQETYHSFLVGGDSLTIMPTAEVRVPGGRHLVGMKLDNRNYVTEEDESNNTWGTQYVFSPSYGLAFDQVRRFDQPPDPTGGWDWVTTGEVLYFNCNGVETITYVPFGGIGYWGAVAILPGAASDLDLRLFEPHTSVREGFDFPVVESKWAMGESDLVLMNFRETSQRKFDAGIYRTQATAVEDYAITTAQSIFSGTDPNGVIGTDSFTADQFIDLYEFRFATPGPYTAILDVAEPMLDLGFSLHGPHLEYYAKNDVHHGTSIDWTDSTGSTASFAFTINTGEEGFYCLAVWKVAASDDHIAGSYTLTIEQEPTLTELAPYTPTGWDATLVPRPAQDAWLDWAPLPTAIPGDTTTTYFNFAFGADREAADPGPCENDVMVDGQILDAFGFPGGSADIKWVVLDDSPNLVTGGRHTLAYMLDMGNQLAEFDETNNVYGAQYVWTPKTMQTNVPEYRTQLWRYFDGWEYVPAGTVLWPNADGVRTPVFQPEAYTRYWGCIALLADDPTIVDLRLHPPSTGFQDGFTTPLVVSQWAPGHSDFILINFNESSARQFDAGIVSGTDDEEQLMVVVSESNYMGANPDGVIGSYWLDSDELVDLFEFYFDRLGTYRVKLIPLDSRCDLGASVYGPGELYYAKSDAHDDGINGPAISFTAPPGVHEFIDLKIDTPGYYATAVWKAVSADYGDSTVYQLDVVMITPSAVEEEDTPRVSRIVGAYPNPFNPMTTVAFELDANREARIEIFDLRGRLVRTLVDETLPAGRHERDLAGPGPRRPHCSSGSYVIKLTAGNTVDMKRVSLLK